MSRYAAAQELGLSALRSLYKTSNDDEEEEEDGGDNDDDDGLFFDVFERVLADETLDPSLRAQVLTPPGFGPLVQSLSGFGFGRGRGRGVGGGGGGDGGGGGNGGGGGVHPLRACGALDQLHESIADRFATQLLDQYWAHAGFTTQDAGEGAAGPVSKWSSARDA